MLKICRERIKHRNQASERERNSLAEENKRMLEERAAAASDATQSAVAGGTAGGGRSAGTFAAGPAGGGGLSRTAGGAAPSRMGRGGSDYFGDSAFRRFAASLRGNKVPHVPREHEKQPAWLRQLRLFLINESLEYTLSVDAAVGPVCVIGTPRSVLLQKHSMDIIEDHTRAYSFISGSVSGSVLDEKLQSCQSVADAWGMLETWVLPVAPAQKHLLEQQFNNILHVPGADPKMYFAGFDIFINRMSAIGIHKPEQQLVDAMTRQLPDEFAMERAILHAERAIVRDKQAITRRCIETTVRNAYAERSARLIK